MPEITEMAAVDGWFTVPDEQSGERPALIGGRCVTCHTYVFPPRQDGCPNPHCAGNELTLVPLSRRGRVWSYTENRYPPPPPYIAADPFAPYALAAVELEHEGLVVLGQVVTGVLAADLRVGMEMEIVLQRLHAEAGEDGATVDRMVYAWAPVDVAGGDRP